MLLSQARTAAFSFVIGSLISALILMVAQKKSLSSIAPLLTSKSLSLFYFLIIIIGVLYSSSILDFIDYFLTKGSRADVSGLIDAYQTSRSILYDVMISNISQNPLTGIGFGISSSPADMNITYFSEFNIPIGASIEKGVLPLAVMEELGVFGFLAFTSWIFLLLKRSSKFGLTSLMITVVALMVNLGESILFSPGGLGMLMLILLSYASSGIAKAPQASIEPSSDSCR